MTIADNYNPIKQLGNGVTVNFSFDFSLLDESYIRVYQEINGVQTLVDPENYDVDFQSSGGSVTFKEAPAAGTYIVIGRNVPLDQETPYKTSSGFPANRVEENLDKLTAITQQLSDEAARAPKLPVGSSDIDLNLPAPSAGKALVWNQEANALTNSTINVDSVINEVTSLTEQAKQSADAAANSESSASASALSASNSANEAAAILNQAETVISTAKDAALQEFNNNSTQKTEAFNTNAMEKQNAVDASAVAAAESENHSQIWAEGTDEEVTGIGGEHSAKGWAEEAQKIYNRTDIQSQSIYQERVILDSPVIVLQERKCRYFRNVASGDAFSIDVSNVKQTDRDITVDLIINMPSVVPFSLAAIVPSASKWLGGEAPDFSEAGEHWIAFVSSDGGVTWRGSYEGMFVS